MLEKIKHKAHQLKVETYAIYLACRDPRLPWYTRALAALVVAHTFSPIDLIPDFIPVLGYLDDLIITPLGIYVVLKMIPKEVMVKARQDANIAEMEGKIQSRAGVILVLCTWALSAALLAVLFFRYYRR